MKIIKTQAQLDKLTEIKAGEEVTIGAALRLPGILHVYGKLTISKPLDTSWYEDRFVRAWGSATVEAWGSATVRLLGFAIGILFPSVKFEIKSDFAKVITRDQVFKTKKKTTVYKKLDKGLIATLELPKGAVFQSENNSKCRTASAKVLKIEDKEGNKVDSGKSQNDNSFVYKVGETVSAPYNEAIEECSTGIHFFLDRESAERY